MRPKRVQFGSLPAGRTSQTENQGMQYYNRLYGPRSYRHYRRVPRRRGYQGGRKQFGKRVGPPQSREKGQQEAQKGWRKFEHKMNGETFRVDTLIDRQKFIPALIDNGSEAYASVNNDLVQRLGLPRIQIPKRPLEGVAATHNGSISEVTYFSIDIEGHTQERIYAYIIPDQRERLILGMPWLRSEAVVYDPRLDELHIHSSGILAKRSGWQKKFEGPRPYAISAASMSAHIRRAKRDHDKSFVTIFAASLQDIEKTLKTKSRSNPLEKLPERYKQFLELFEDEEGSQLPPHRPGIDMKIQLEQDENGKEKEVPWGPLYSMLRVKSCCYCERPYWSYWIRVLSV